MDLSHFLELAGQLGLAVTLTVTLWYVILTPRKTHDGKRRSSVLVPGWIHDDQRAEMERRARAYEVALKDEQSRGRDNIQQWRALRDEEIARRADAENDTRALLAAVNGLTRDVALLLEIQRMAERNDHLEGDARAASDR